VEIEALQRWGMGRGYPHPQLTRGSGGAFSAPPAGLGRAPAENEFDAI